MEKDKDRQLVNGRFLLQKFPGKGGWTYAALPGLAPDSSQPFGWRRVKGSIDDYPIKDYHLMPMGNGRLFLPVRKEIRSSIGKKEGDEVWIQLFPDESALEIPTEIRECLEMEETALLKFQALKPYRQRELISWIMKAKKAETKATRISRLLDLLQKEKI